MEGLYGHFGTKGRARSMRRSPETMKLVDGKQRGSSDGGKQTRSSMTTEYQEMFLHPGSHTTAKLHQSARRSANNATVFKVNDVTIKGTETQSQPQSSWREASHYLVPSNQENQAVHQEESVTSVYQYDFRGWRAHKQQPCKFTDNLKVHQGLVPVGASREGLLVQEPFQSITSYRSHYIRHPLQNRTRGRAPVCRHHFNDFMQHFKTCSLGTKIHSQAGAKKLCKAAAMCTRMKPVSSSLSTSDQKQKSLETTVRGNLRRSPKLIPNAPQALTR